MPLYHSFLELFQTEAPLVHVLYEELCRLVYMMMGRCVKASVYQNKTGQDLKEVKHGELQNQLSDNPYLKFPKDSVQLRITPKKILCGVLGHLLRSNFLLKNGKQSGECVNLYDYHHIWNELRTFVTSGVLG